MSIHQVKTTSVVIMCPRCHATTEKSWNALTIGSDEMVNTFAITCDTCALLLRYFLPEQRITMAQLALAEVFSLAKATASYAGTWVEADVTAILGDRKKLSDYETLPFTVGANVGHIHYTSASLERNATQLLALALQGYIFYGSTAARKGYIDALTVESSKRKLLYIRSNIKI